MVTSFLILILRDFFKKSLNKIPESYKKVNSIKNFFEIDLGYKVLYQFKPSSIQKYHKYSLTL